MALFVHSKLESHSNRMYLFCFIIVIMAGFGFDDDDFSLSGLMQEGHNFDVTVISSSSDDDNYDGLLDCAHKLAGETADKTSTSMEGGVQQGVEPGANFPISKTADTALILSNDMASSSSHSDQLIHVSFMHFNGLQVHQICVQSIVNFVVFAGFSCHSPLLHNVIVT